MNLNSEIVEDLEEVLFNEEEFGEKHTFAGVETITITSSAAFKKKYKNRRDETGIYEKGITYYIKKSDFNISAEIDDEILIDNDEFRVVDVEDQVGCYRVDLVQHVR